MYLLYALVCVVLIIVAYTRIRLLNVPLERDEGEYAYMGQLLLKGIPPYLNAYTMKLPGVSAVYALFMFLFGQTAFGIHLGLLIVNGLCVYFVYRLTLQLFERDNALISCSIYAILSVSQSILGVFAHATHFVVLFTLPGLILLLHYFDNKRDRYIFSSGICFGLAFTMKQHAIILIFFAVLYLIWHHLAIHGFKRKELYTGCIFFTIGTGLPFLFIVVNITFFGAFSEFWFWTVQYAREYSTGISIYQGMELFHYTVTDILKPFFIIWLFAGIGCIFICLQKANGFNRLFTGLFVLFSFLSVCPGFYFRQHYFVLVLPAISILAGHGITSIVTLLLSSSQTKIMRSFAILVILVPSLGYGINYEKEYLFTFSLYDVSRALYGNNPFPEALIVSSYLKSHTTEQDKIAILGSEPELLFYANRFSATGHIYMYGLMEMLPFAEQMQIQAITQITQAKPKYVVFVNVSTSWLRQPYSNMTIFNWADNYLKNYYQLVGIVDMLEKYDIRYIWDEHVIGYVPVSDYFIVIYKRKTDNGGDS